MMDSSKHNILAILPISGSFRQMEKKRKQQKATFLNKKKGVA